MTIIDMHAHLGDILFPGGGRLITQKGIRKKRTFDPGRISEFFNHRFSEAGDPAPNGWVYRQVKKAGMAANFSGTLENFKASMDRAEIEYSVALPIPPNVCFSDIHPVAEKNRCIIPFTSVDFSTSEDMGAALALDVKKGARGIKLHPILQGVKLNGKRVYEAIEAFAPFELPVLLHTGVCHYYLASHDQKREWPEYGAVHYARDLIAAFPGVRFIVGHAGLSETGNVKEMLGGFDNAWIETSFKGVAAVKDLIKTFGPEKILFGSDWPWGNRRPALRVIRRACTGDKAIEKRILFQNSTDLLRL